MLGFLIQSHTAYISHVLQQITIGGGGGGGKIIYLRLKENSLFTGMKVILASVPQCAVYTKSFTEFINNIERLSDRLVMNAQHCFVVIIVEEPLTKIEKY